MTPSSATLARETIRQAKSGPSSRLAARTKAKAGRAGSGGPGPPAADRRGRPRATVPRPAGRLPASSGQTGREPRRGSAGSWQPLSVLRAEPNGDDNAIGAICWHAMASPPSSFVLACVSRRFIVSARALKRGSIPGEGQLATGRSSRTEPLARDRPRRLLRAQLLLSPRHGRQSLGIRPRLLSVRPLSAAGPACCRSPSRAAPGSAPPGTTSASGDRPSPHRREEDFGKARLPGPIRSFASATRRASDHQDCAVAGDLSGIGDTAPVPVVAEVIARYGHADHVRIERGCALPWGVAHARIAEPARRRQYRAIACPSRGSPESRTA